MALIKKFRKALFGGYKRKDVENFVLDIAELTTSQQEILNQKIQETDDLNRQIDSFEVERLLFLQQIKSLESERDMLNSKIDEVESNNLQLQTELSLATSKYDANIAQMADQLDAISYELEQLKTETDNSLSYSDLADDVSEILMTAEDIATDIIDGAKEKSNEPSQNIIDISSARAKMPKVADRTKSDVKFDDDFELLENEILNMQVDLNNQIEKILSELNDNPTAKNDTVMLKSVGE